MPESMFAMNLGSNLITILKARELSLSRLARMAGVPVQTLHGWTLGRKNVNLVQVRLVCGVLGVSLDELCFSSQATCQLIGEIQAGDIQVTVKKIKNGNNSEEK